MTAEIVCSVFRVPAYKIGVGQPPSSDNVEALGSGIIPSACRR
ncbi:hypothetical protein [Escherichia coli]|nr:hypothetical protein [Escherichia coli]MCW7175667.1 hypothetical protein [Escherichia coli]